MKYPPTPVSGTITTATNSNTTIRKLAESMKFAAPIAAALGQSIEETSIALGLLANAGIKGSIAGTNLSSALIQLVSSSEKADKILRQYGSSFEAVNPEVVGLIDIIREFKRINISTTDAVEIFTRKGARAILAMTSSSEESIQSLIDVMNLSFGSALEQAIIRIDNVSGAFVELKSRIQTIAISIFKSFEKSLLNLLRTTLEYLNAVIEWIKKNQENFGVPALS